MHRCDTCNTTIKSTGYLFPTLKLIRAPKFWELVFTIYNIQTSQEDLLKRVEVVKNFMSNESPWVLCNNCAGFIEVDLIVPTADFNKFKKSNRKFLPENNGDARKFISPEESRVIALHAATCPPNKV